MQELEKINRAFDIAFTIGMSMIFTIVGIVSLDIINLIVSIPFAIWIISLWLKLLKARGEN